MVVDRTTSQHGRGLPQISDAELVVMKVVWARAPVTAISSKPLGFVARVDRHVPTQT
jgi:hypothetical protein